MIERHVTQWFEKAGIQINGSNPWDIKINNPRAYRRFFFSGSLGGGESYMDGDWDCEALDQMTAKLYQVHYHHKFYVPDLFLTLQRMRSWVSNLGNRVNAMRVNKVHYDAGNDVYEAILDKYMMYSSGNWKNANNLQEAQDAKLDLICKKLYLKPGMRVLDIGCGWGGFERFAAENYDVSVVGYSLSKEQLALAEATKGNLPVEYRFADYRDITGMYDRVVSIEMICHVGYKNYRTFMEVVANHLTDDGLFLLQNIGASISRTSNDPWFERYIYPNSMLASAAQLTRATEGCLIAEDWHNFGADYDKTLMAWHKNFEEAWPSLAYKYDERFHRMWQFYLLTITASFRTRYNHVWQTVYSKNGVQGGYESIR